MRSTYIMSRSVRWTEKKKIFEFHHSTCHGLTRDSSKEPTVKTCWVSITVFSVMLAFVSPPPAKLSFFLISKGKSAVCVATSQVSVQMRCSIQKPGYCFSSLTVHRVMNTQVCVVPETKRGQTWKKEQKVDAEIQVNTARASHQEDHVLFQYTSRYSSS